MTLRELLQAAGVAAPEGGGDVAITGLAYRSESVTQGTLFFCVPGFVVDGHAFAPDAVARGAAALVCERPLGLGVPEVVVPQVRAAMGPVAAAFHGNPTAELRMVGVTGTNGKTTTAFLVRHVLEARGIATGLLGTVQSVVGGRVEEVERTTPEAIDLQATFRRMRDAGDEACVMEVSSHALELHRAAGIEFDVAVFTNLTQDHLDFHGTLDAYYASKRRLFTPEAGAPPAAAVVNADDEWGARLAQEVTAEGRTPVATFGLERGDDFRAADVRYDAAGAAFECHARGAAVDVRVPLPGLFNVYNALAAIAATHALGVSPHAAAEALATARRVPGRFEPVEEGQDFGVLVDYAHTPDSLENVLESARGLLDQAGDDARLIVVFGAGGDRDREKRPLMGAAARRLADHVLVTSDNPRSEDPDSIIAAIVAGAEREAPPTAASSMEVEPDRRAAIERAMELARPGDIVLIAGKGHEQGQEFEGGRKVPFDDRDGRARRAARPFQVPRRAAVIDLTPEEIARAAVARVAAAGDGGAPARAVVDSRAVAPGDLFVGLPGERTDGGRFAAAAIADGAWGVIVTPDHAKTAAAAGRPAYVFETVDPQAALAGIARTWLARLREQGCRVVAVTGSTGKTSTKDILRAMLAPAFEGRVHANRENFNTEIGLPLTVLEADAGVQVLVLEMAMRGMGQIRELAQIAHPEVGVITNIGPVHLELVGTIERVAEAKAELIAELRGAHAACVVPAAEEALYPHLRSDIRVITFAPWAGARGPAAGGVDAIAGAAADVRALSVEDVGGHARVELALGTKRTTLELNFAQDHNITNALAAVAAAHALGVEPDALAEGAREVRFSGLRGEELQLADGVLIVNDCYNANPVSMRAAIDDLAARADKRGARRMVAVLGDMRELGPEAAHFHRQVGARAADAGVSLVVAVGEHAGDYALGHGGETREAADAEEAAALVPGLIEPGDIVLVKGSRGVGLERVTRALEDEI